MILRISLLLFFCFSASGCHSYIPVDPTIPAFSTRIPATGYGEPFNRRAAKERITIVVDAGHGGEDFGTHSLDTPKYQEKNLNMSTAMMLKNFLQYFGYRVVMTRTNDVFISLEERAQMTNKLKPKLFVSVHYNSAPSKQAEGIEVYYYLDEKDRRRKECSKYLAEAILSKVIQNTQAKSRGVKHGNYSVIRETKVPAVLIEGGFLTNKNEMDKLKNATYLKQIALGIAQGIQEYIATEALLGKPYQ